MRRLRLGLMRRHSAFKREIDLFYVEDAVQASTALIFDSRVRPP